MNAVESKITKQFSFETNKEDVFIIRSGFITQKNI